MNTEMQIINVVAGSPEWHAHRQDSNNASDVPAAKGMSPYTTRSELLRRRATGIIPEVDPATQRRFDAGHAAEAAARPLAERIIGEELFPATGVRVVDGVRLSASFDGLTMMGGKIFECKLWNEGKAAFVRDGMIPPQDHGQVIQQLVISKADACLYMVSDGTEERTVHTWVTLQEGDEKDLLAMWRQFEQDLAAYEHIETVAAPVAASIEALPALFVQVEGKVLATNLDAFKLSAQKFIDGIKTELVNDQDFADADKMVKFLKDGEERLALAKSQALSQTASIDELFRTVDAISEQMRSKRLALDKLVKSEKDRRRVDIVAIAQQEMVAHVSKLNDRIGGNYMPRTAISFADAIRGLKSLDSMRDKVAGALANAKIEANEIADRIEFNVKQITVDGANYNYLVHDFAQICTKPTEDFAAIMAQRIAANKAAEAEKAAAAKQAEEDRIAAAVEAERKAGEARAAAAVEAERVAEAKRVAEAAQNDQRGKTEDATHAVQQATELPQAPAAITPPIQDHFSDTGNMVDAAMITEFLALQACSPADKKAMRATVEKWETYRIKMMAARGMAAAA